MLFLYVVTAREAGCHHESGKTTLFVLPTHRILLFLKCVAEVETKTRKQTAA
jgi:hypothetical protein